MKFIMILITMLALTSCAHHGKGCKPECKDMKQCEMKKKNCKDPKQCALKKKECAKRGTKTPDHKAVDCTSGQCQLHKKDKAN